MNIKLCMQCNEAPRKKLPNGRQHINSRYCEECRIDRVRAMDMEPELIERLREMLGHSSAAEIAADLGISYSKLYRYCRFAAISLRKVRKRAVL